MNNPYELICHGCEISDKLYLYELSEFIYALCKECISTQLEIREYLEKAGEQ